LLAAAKMDDDYKKNLLPTDFYNWATVSKCFINPALLKHDFKKLPDYETVDLPPFIKHALISTLRNSQSER